MRSGVEKPGAFDLARFIDQNAQRFAGTVQAVGQQGRKSGLQGILFDTHGHALDSFEGVGKNAPKKPPAGSPGQIRGAVHCRPPLFGRYAPSSLRPAMHRKARWLQIYRRDVALTF